MLHRLTHFLRRWLLRSSCYRWRVFTPQVSRDTIAPLLPHYNTYAAGSQLQQRQPNGTFRRLSHRQIKHNRALTAKRVVYLCDGRTLAGGLADRFKGILSLYAICRQLGYDFRILYTSPFSLDQYLEPAHYDWRISPAELHTDTAALLVLENTDDADYQTRRQADWLRSRLQESPAEIHVITNSNHAYRLDYAALFHQLFRPTKKLEAALNEEIQQLGQRYISISARFLSMLGDFRETGANSSLPAAEAEDLICRNMEQIERLHAAHTDCRILVNSDSMRFLSRAETLPYVYVVKGNVAHTDLMASSQHGADDEAADRMHLKLFLDFMLIARAERVFLLRTGSMRISGFPYAAARTTKAPFEVIEF